MRIVTGVNRQVQVPAGGVCYLGYRMMALEIMPDHVHLFVKAHRSDSPSRIADPFKGFSSRLRADSRTCGRACQAGGPGRVSRRPVWCPRRLCAGMPERRTRGRNGRNERDETRF